MSSDDGRAADGGTPADEPTGADPAASEPADAATDGGSTADRPADRDGTGPGDGGAADDTGAGGVGPDGVDPRTAAPGTDGADAARDGPLLSVEGLRKYYYEQDTLVDRLLGNEPRSVQAVDGVSFTVDRGETLGLVGESGCGKSTTGETLLRLREPTDGTVRFDGADVFAMDDDELARFRRRAQVVFQDPFSSLDPRMTAGQIIAEPLTVHGLADRERRRERAADLLERVGLSAGQIDRYPHEFSGGQRQRIGVARALALEPDFLVLDEPVSALDVSVQAQILNLLEDLQADLGLTYLFIAHDLSVVRHISDRVAVMYLGEIVETGPVDAIFEDPRHPYTQKLLESVPRASVAEQGRRVEALRGDVPSPRDPPPGCHFHTRCPYAREVCRAEEPPAFDVDDGRQATCFRVAEDHPYWDSEPLPHAREG